MMHGTTKPLDAEQPLRDVQPNAIAERPLREQFDAYLQQYVRDPRGAFRGAYEDELGFRNLATRLYGFQPHMTDGRPGTDRFHGLSALAFQTLGELAARFGYTLRPGVDASLRIDQLPRTPDIDSLFVTETEPEFAQVRALLSIFSTSQGLSRNASDDRHTGRTWGGADVTNTQGGK